MSPFTAHMPLFDFELYTFFVCLVLISILRSTVVFFTLVNKCSTIKHGITSKDNLTLLQGHYINAFWALGVLISFRSVLINFYSYIYYHAEKSHLSTRHTELS